MTQTGSDPSRRRVMTGAGAMALFATTQAHSATVTPENRLWYLRPAAIWDEALPIGNGRLGAMVFGGVVQERLQLNEDTLWAGGPYTPDNPDAYAALAEVRRLITAGQYEAATELASTRMMAKPLWQMSYGSLGDLLLTFRSADTPLSYQRELNLETAINTSSHTTASGRHQRETFASAPDQVIVHHISGPARSVGFTLDWRAPRKVEYTSPDYSGSATPLVISGMADWQHTEAFWTNPATVSALPDGDDAMLFGGSNEDGPNTPGRLRYALRVKIVTDGTLSQVDGRLTVSDATTATLIIAAATSFVRFDDVSGDPVSIVRQGTDAAAEKSLKQLRQAHLTEYRSYYGTMSLDLGRTDAATRPTHERVSGAETSDDPALAALYFAYSRYLLISCSRPGSQPANLQGIWNEGLNPPWQSKYTININTEMNYWPADAAGLSLCVEPLLAMIEDLAVTGARTAQTMYQARGWVTHHNTDLWRASAPIDGPLWGLWPCGGAWLCNSLWDHYDHTRDPKTLKRLYPLMRGAALFFLDTLIEDPAGRGLITSPSISPENQHPYGSSVCAGPAMDRQILRDLFGNVISAGKLIGEEAAFLDQVGYARARLAPDRVGKAGQFQEWLEDWDMEAPDPQHRHVSHLYAVYPSHQANVRDTPALIEAAKTTLRQRGDMATGWGTAWRLCLWARMGEAITRIACSKDFWGRNAPIPTCSTLTRRFRSTVISAELLAFSKC